MSTSSFFLYLKNWKSLGQALIEGNDLKFWKQIERGFSEKAFEIANSITPEVWVSHFSHIWGGNIHRNVTHETLSNSPE